MVDDPNGTSVPAAYVPPGPAEASVGLLTDDGAGPAAAAEDVRAWLVEARGGAAFLSPTDGALLVGWLEGGVPVADIFRAIERTAARRIAKRTRTPFTLASCAAQLPKARAGGKGRGTRDTVPALLDTALDPVTEPALRAREGALVARTQAALAARAGTDRLQDGCRIVHHFHVALWDLLAPVRSAFLAQAAEALHALATTLDEAAFHQLCEEWARATVRARHPALTAVAIYEEAVLGC